MDKDQPPEDWHGVEHPPARRAQAHHREVQRHGRRRTAVARPMLWELQERHQGDSQTLRHQQERHMAPEPPLVCHHHLPLQRCAD